MQAEKRREELGDFLKTRRARIQPEEVGLPRGQRRRTPGLRREEVAQLAGIGVDWYTWLEQGRDIRVSEDVLESLVRTLHLSEAERRHLYLLAHKQAPPLKQVAKSVEASPVLQQLVDQQGNFPTYIIDYKWDVVVWNKSSVILFDDIERMPRRNVLLMIFKNRRFRKSLTDWQGHAQRVMAQYRATYGQYIGDPNFETIIEQLHIESPEFADWWDNHDIVGRADVHKEIIHPQVGNLYFDQIAMTLAHAPDMMMAIHIPEPDTDTAEKIEQLLSRMKA